MVGRRANNLPVGSRKPLLLAVGVLLVVFSLAHADEREFIRAKLFTINKPLDPWDTQKFLGQLAELEPTDATVAHLVEASRVSGQKCDQAYRQRIEDEIKAYTWDEQSGLYLPTAVTIAPYLDTFLDHQVKWCVQIISMTIERDLAGRTNEEQRELLTLVEAIANKGDSSSLDLRFAVPFKILESGILSYLESKKLLDSKVMGDKTSGFRDFERIYKRAIETPCKIFRDRVGATASKYFPLRPNDRLAKLADDPAAASVGDHIKRIMKINLVCYEIVLKPVRLNKAGDTITLVESVHKKYASKLSVKLGRLANKNKASSSSS